jgi:hypothetical protein
MPPHLRAFLWAAACSATVLGVGGCLPLWTRVARDGGCWVEMETVPIWRALADRRPAPAYEPSEWTRNKNSTNCLILLAVAGGVGAVAYWARRPRTRPLEADDYSDGPGGSVPEGRAVPR